MSKWFLPYQIGPRRPHWWSVVCVATGTSSCSSSSSLPAVWLCGVMIDVSFAFTLPPPQPPPISAPLVYEDAYPPKGVSQKVTRFTFFLFLAFCKRYWDCTRIYVQSGWNSLPGESLSHFQGSIRTLHHLAPVWHLVGHPYVDWYPLMATKYR